MCYTRRKIEGGVGALRESDDTNFLKPNGQSRILNIYGNSINVTWFISEMMFMLVYTKHSLLKSNSYWSYPLIGLIYRPMGILIVSFKIHNED